MLSSQVFSLIAEYVGRDCLDLLACLDLAAAATSTGSLQLKVHGAAPSCANTSSSSGGGGKAASNSTTDSSSGGVLWPVYVINDVNLLTVLDTVKLILDYSS
jgi:hypothetical protein